ncbi:uncharacterized protein BHQ10_009868 [Talaromyces amestolkiae]|uniref:Uncharacterized protein n=1 Tax=Talaromyces amestolkiae TaxID=1196081 RepID=A0A364LDG6_TALAM|nr:uncharacterized protein BHQ10_009868 [Talaromyces amestolkiae]RAO73856.1 hypothetical protein BHQ10_009868 [Talaromyces amestolkiae]
MADSTLYLYTSLTAGSSHIITATSRLETILKANKIPFQAIDIATDDAARRLWGRYSKGRKLPGLVKFNTIVGDLEQIEEWNEYGELKAEIRAVADPNDFSSEQKKDTVEVPKLAPVAATTTSNKTSGTSTPHIQIQNPPVTENKEDQRTLALRLAGEEAAARAKETARSKLGAKPVTIEGDGKATPTPDPKAKGTEALVLAKKPDEKKDDEKTTTTTTTDSDTETKRPSSTTGSPAGRRRSVVPELPASLKRPSLADEVAAVSSANFHADNAELLGLVGHHRGSIISATTVDEQEQVRKDIRASISEAPADGDIDALRKTAEEKKGDTIFEDDEESDQSEEEETKPATEVGKKEEVKEETQKEDPMDESKAGVSVAD